MHEVLDTCVVRGAKGAKTVENARMVVMWEQVSMDEWEYAFIQQWQ